MLEGFKYQGLEDSINDLIDWPFVRRSLEKYGADLEKCLSLFFLSDTNANLLKDPRIILSNIDYSTIADYSELQFPKVFKIDEQLFLDPSKRDQQLSVISQNVFTFLLEDLKIASTFTEKAIVIAKSALFSSPTELLFSAMSAFRGQDAELSKRCLNRLIEVTKSEYPLKYVKQLDTFQEIQVFMPLVHSLIKEERMIVSLKFLNQLKDYYGESRLGEWAEMAALLRLSSKNIMGSGQFFSLNEGLTEGIRDEALRDVKGLIDKVDEGQSEEDFKHGLSGEFVNYSKLIEERLVGEFLNIIESLPLKILECKDAHSLTLLFRNIQDYLLAELTNYFINSVMFGSALDREPLEIYKKFLEGCEATLSNKTESISIINYFKLLIRSDLIKYCESSYEVVKKIDELKHVFLDQQMSVASNIVDYILPLLKDKAKFDSKTLRSALFFGFLSPYRFLANMSWLSWANLEGDVSYKWAKEEPFKGPDFNASLMTSWVIYKELEYNVVD